MQLIMPPKPSDWTPAAEVEYQQALTNIRARIAAAGPNDDTEVLIAALAAMSDPQNGRLYFLKAKAAGDL